MTRTAEPLSGLDAWWLRVEEPRHPLVNVVLLRFARPLTDAAARGWIETRLLAFARFKERVVVTGALSRPIWERDPRFELDRHLRFASVARADAAALREVIDDEMDRALDPSRPLWDLILVRDEGGVVAIIARVHHCVADGFSLLRLLTELVDADAPIELPRASGKARERPPLRALPKSLARLFTMRPDSPSSLRSAEGSRTRVAWSSRTPIDEIKRMARAHGATLNDVLLAALSGALRRVMQERGDALAGAELRVVVPVNLQPFDARSRGLGNGFGLVYLELPVGQADAQRRIAVTKERMDALKRSPEAIVISLFESAAGRMPAALQSILLTMFAGKSTAAVTNVPGPIRPMRIAGAEVDDVVFFIPQSGGHRLGVSIFTYAGSLRLSVAADANVLADPRELVRAYELELSALA